MKDRAVLVFLTSILQLFTYVSGKDHVMFFKCTAQREFNQRSQGLYFYIFQKSLRMNNFQRLEALVIGLSLIVVISCDVFVCDLSIDLIDVSLSYPRTFHLLAGCHHSGWVESAGCWQKFLYTVVGGTGIRWIWTNSDRIGYFHLHTH